MLEAMKAQPRVQGLMWYYYLSIIILVLFIGSIAILLVNNQHYSKKQIRFCLQSLLMLALYDLSDSAIVALTHIPAQYTVWHLLAKALSFCVAPAIGYFLVKMLEPEKSYRSAGWLVLGNAIFEITSVFTGWCFYADQENFIHNGPYRFIYSIVWLLMIAIVAKAFFSYGKKVSVQNRYFLAYIVAIVIFGVMLQEFSAGYIRTSAMSITVGYLIILIHFQEFGLASGDTAITSQKEKLLTDALTGLSSRYAFEQELNLYSRPLADKRVLAFSIDLNGLKAVNDTQGHLLGDQLIREAGDVIYNTFPYNRCYRTGGDEFAIFIFRNKDRSTELLNELHKNLEAANLHSKLELSFSVGVASSVDFPMANLRGLIGIADQRMYADKKQYYMDPKHDRRQQV